MNFQQSKRPVLCHNLVWRGKKIVQSYKYLGMQIKPDKFDSVEVQKRDVLFRSCVI